jgi:CheY-like chemotaxis protein
VPVIYMAGNDSPAVREAALDSGCVALLTKPFSKQELIEALNRASAEQSGPTTRSEG